jgi:hypothetical protein
MTPRPRRIVADSRRGLGVVPLQSLVRQERQERPEHASLSRFAVDYPPKSTLPEDSDERIFRLRGAFVLELSAVVESSLVWFGGAFSWLLFLFRAGDCYCFELGAVFVSGSVLSDRKTPQERRVPINGSERRVPGLSPER